MSLYNVKNVNGMYNVTKFTDDLDVESTYETSEVACTCPAGHCDSCRHRQMLPAFISMGRVNSAWMYDHDNEQWFYFDHENGRLLTQPPRRFEGGLWRRRV